MRGGSLDPAKMPAVCERVTESVLTRLERPGEAEKLEPLRTAARS